MNAQDIIHILQGKRGANPERGVEEDDLLANAFFELEAHDWPAFWSAFTEALRTLIDEGAGMPVYLAARFMTRMANIQPPRLPSKKSPFDFLITANTHMPEALAGRLLLLSVLHKGTTAFWKQQIKATLDLLEATTQDETYAVAAVVHAFVECATRTDIPAEYWQKLFEVITHLPSVPRMELLNLLVCVEKATGEQRVSSLEEELDVGLEAASPSIKRETQEKLESVFKAWLELNEPHEAIARWLRKQKDARMTPRNKVAASLAKTPLPFIPSSMQVAA